MQGLLVREDDVWGLLKKITVNHLKIACYVNKDDINRQGQENKGGK